MTDMDKHTLGCFWLFWPRRGRLRRFVADRRGATAIEFALIVPLLFSLYFVTLEVAQGIEANKKVGRIASQVGDLVAQQQKTSTNDLDAIMKIAGAILRPYDRSVPEMTITAIEITDDNTPVTRVVWSRTFENGTYKEGDTPGTPATVPPKLNKEGTFLIRVETALDYKPLIAWSADQKMALGLASAFSSIPMRETYYLRPRVTDVIDCLNCDSNS